MAEYSGSCHCGTVTFRVEASPTRLVRCNCSLCSVRGGLYFPIDETKSVEILTGESNLVTYRFNTKTAEHFFCKTCGIHCFHRARFDAVLWSVNARCLEAGLPDLPIEDFDGRNWEPAARREGWTE
jgi:hypothetical protein